MNRRVGTLLLVAMLSVLLVASLQPSGAAHGQAGFAGRSALESSAGDAALAPEAPIISVWYGNTQAFGFLGNPQEQINILGNVQGANRLHYSLNGGPDVEVARRGGAAAAALGPDEAIWHPGGISQVEPPPDGGNADGRPEPLAPGVPLVTPSRRLVSPGDFNIEIDTADLRPGANTVVIKADDGQAVKTVTVNYSAGTTWPLPYAIDWSSVGNINDVAQIVDGQWVLEGDSIRPTVIGYDRVVALGDVAWQDFDVLVPITIHRFPEEDVGGVGVAARWQGHFQVADEQPGAGWWRLGAYGLYRNLSGDNSKLWMYTGHYDIVRDQSGFQMAMGEPYYFRLRVKTRSPGQSAYYSLKVWAVGQPEPAGWTFEEQDGPPDELATGSVLLVAHEVDASFGDVLVRPLLDVSVSTSGSGTVQVTPELEGESDAYLHGDTLTLTATADPGWAFVGWSGDLSGAENPSTLTLTGDADIRATFGLERKLDVGVIGNGSVLLDPEGPTYGEGALVKLKPAPETRWVFFGWSGDDKEDLIDNGDGTWLLVIDGDKAVTAEFGQGTAFLPLVSRSR